MHTFDAFPVAGLHVLEPGHNLPLHIEVDPDPVHGAFLQDK